MDDPLEAGISQQHQHTTLHRNNVTTTESQRPERVSPARALQRPRLCSDNPPPGRHLFRRRFQRRRSVHEFQRRRLARSKISTESVSCILVTIQATCLMYYARRKRRIDSAGYDRWSLAMRTLIVSPEIVFPTERSSTTLGSTHKILLLEVDIFVVSPQIC